MIFNTHSHLAGKHAFLSASKSHWSNYDEEKLSRVFKTALATQRGTELHALAAEMIRLGVRPKATKQTFNMYVNDAIGFRMRPEQVLYVSDHAFGTADAISFRREKGAQVLRIHDLKTGVSHTSERQLEIYAAFFCLEYSLLPVDIEIELRIYQNDEIRVYEGDPDLISKLMATTVRYSNRIDEIRREALT